MIRISILGLVVAALASPVYGETQTSNTAISDSKPILDQDQKETWALLAGKWYGSQPTKNGGLRQHIVERSTDGKYKITFRSYDRDGTFKDKTEVGFWGASGPVYFSMYRGSVEGGKFRPANPANPYNYDAYRILTLTSETFEYESYDSGNRYVVKRVSSDFTFPKP
jgi:hypothetical protein